ncbi:MAG: hypothetical protein ABIJ56_20055, partial [Pseudomonadota bacterium]
KVWFVEINTLPSGAERNLLIGSYFLLKNSTSYYYIVGGGEITWYPEYEIDLGWTMEEPPEDVEELRVAGDAGGDGIYRRDYSHGIVLVNASDRELSTDIGPGTYRAAAFSGGGVVSESGGMPSCTLAYEGSYTGSVSVAARSSLILQVEAGPPPPGEEPVDPPADEDGEPAPDPPPDSPAEAVAEGADAAPDATTDAPADTPTDTPADGAADAAQDNGSDPGEDDDSDSGCGCAVVR